MASRRAGLETVRLERRPVRGRPASRNRHRCPHRIGRRFGHERGRRVRRAPASAGAVSDRPHRGRLVGHARPPRLDRSDGRDAGRRGRCRRHDRPEWRARRDRAVRLSRHPAHGGPERLRRSVDALASSTRARAASAGAAAATGAGCGFTGRCTTSGSGRLGPSASSPCTPARPRSSSIRKNAEAGGGAGSCEHDADVGVATAFSSLATCSACSNRSAGHVGSGLTLPISRRGPNTSAGTVVDPHRRRGDPPAPRRTDALGPGCADAVEFEEHPADPHRHDRIRARGIRARESATPEKRDGAPVRATAPP